MAAGGGRDILDRLDNLERENRKLTQALTNVAAIIANAVKPLEVPPRNKWNPPLTKIKDGSRITSEEFQRISTCLDYDVYERTQLLDNAIIAAFQGMLLKHIKVGDLTQAIKKKTVTVADAMKHIEKISTTSSDEELLQYITSSEMIAYIKD